MEGFGSGKDFVICIYDVCVCIYYTLYKVIYNGGKRSGGPEPWLHAGLNTPRKRPAEINLRRVAVGPNAWTVVAICDG